MPAWLKTTLKYLGLGLLGLLTLGVGLVLLRRARRAEARADLIRKQTDLKAAGDKKLDEIKVRAEARIGQIEAERLKAEAKTEAAVDKIREVEASDSDELLELHKKMKAEGEF
jgi:hypothetical protein